MRPVVHLLAGGFMTDGTMLVYQRNLKQYSRDLRNQLTIAESILWKHLRYRQILGVKFYRQKPLLNYIVDFYAHRAKLVIECDGSQHLQEEFLINDEQRDAHLRQEGILVLRFTNIQIVKKLDSVLTVIWDHVNTRLSKSPTR